MAAFIPLSLAHQKRDEILDAIDLLAPHPVRRQNGYGPDF